jgi:glycosyltransferase involved in cell wall biosynthesis
MSSAASPRVSVLLPVYNAAAFLRPAIDSILGQSFADFALLVLDDGSIDDSAAIAAGYGDPRIRILPTAQNQGLARTLNRGLAAARGELVARQDGDDVSHRERLARQAALLDADPRLALVGTQVDVIGEDGAPTGRQLRFPCDDSRLRRQLRLRNCFAHTAVMFRRAVIAGLGGYDPSFRYCQDFALWSRLAAAPEHHGLANLPEVLGYYRVHGHARMSDRMKWRRVVENARVIGRNLLPPALGGRIDEAVPRRSG